MITPNLPKRMEDQTLPKIQPSTSSTADISTTKPIEIPQIIPSSLPNPLLDHHAIDLTNTETQEGSFSSEQLSLSTSGELSPQIERRSISTEDLPIEIPAIVTYWEEIAHVETPLTSPQSTASSSSTISTERTPSSPTVLAARKEMRTLLFNHMTQTKIEVAVLEAYMKNNHHLLPEDVHLLNEYLSHIRHIATFEEQATAIIDEIEQKGGSVEEIINAYFRIWGDDSYNDYARTVKSIIDLSPRVSELLQDHTKYPGSFLTFDKYVIQLSKNNKTVRRLKRQQTSIDSTISVPQNKAGGRLYMEWLTRVPMQLSFLSSHIGNQSHASAALNELVTTCQDKITSVNISLQIEALDKELPQIIQYLEEAQLFKQIPETLEAARTEKIETKRQIQFMREKLAPLKSLEENQTIPRAAQIPAIVNSANLEEFITNSHLWISMIENDIEPFIKEHELKRIEELGWQKRNKMNLEELIKAVDLIKAFQSGQFLTSEPLNPKALEAQRLDLVRLQLLLIQQFTENDIAGFKLRDKQRYAELIDQCIEDISPYQSRLPGRRKISHTQLRRVRAMLS